MALNDGPLLLSLLVGQIQLAHTAKLSKPVTATPAHPLVAPTFSMSHAFPAYAVILGWGLRLLTVGDGAESQSKANQLEFFVETFLVLLCLSWLMDE